MDVSGLGFMGQYELRGGHTRYSEAHGSTPKLSTQKPKPQAVFRKREGLSPKVPTPNPTVNPKP